MTLENNEKRSEFRFPVMFPVECSRPDNSDISSYSLDLSRGGTFISSDLLLNVGKRFGIHLAIPVEHESFRIFRTEVTVAWNKSEPFKESKNGMGVRFIDPLPEDMLLDALTNSAEKLLGQTGTEKVLEERGKEPESESEKLKRLTTLGRHAEKIIFELSDPILTLSGRLEIIKTKMDIYREMLETDEETNKDKYKRIITEFNNFCGDIDQIVKDYKIISELARITRCNNETLETRLEKYLH